MPYVRSLLLVGLACTLASFSACTIVEEKPESPNTLEGGGNGANGDASGGASAWSGSRGTSTNSGGKGSGASVVNGSSGGASQVGNSSQAPYVEPTESFNLSELPTTVPRVSIEISSDGLDQLDAEPLDGPNVVGAFIDNSGVRHEPADLNYRGAYALQSLIMSGRSQRNWKVKVAKDQKYLGRREWNFNFEQHVRQKLAYDLMRFAGVKVPPARHVQLSVNGDVAGAYLQYEDPDNKDFLAEKFGDASGDLYKAGYDIPEKTRYFATLEYLGDSDSDYEMHYRKMTNNDDPAKAVDHSNLRAFLKGLNETSDGELEGFLRANFDTKKFISYLVVANFISHWDSYPQRPKNFWLYHVAAAGRWVFIPWDMDGTFGTEKFALNPMGTDASVYYQFDGFEDYEGRHSEEGTKRPLVTRMMKIPAFRKEYVARYREALASFLKEDYLLGRVTGLCDLVAPEIPEYDREGFDWSCEDMKTFITERTINVSKELAN